MSAVLRTGAPFTAPMTEADLPEVLAIEREVYAFPWTPGNFRDSIRAGYACWTWRDGGRLVGYCISATAAGETHLLNLSIDADCQRQGYGARLLEVVIATARRQGSHLLLLEVRPSNAAAIGLYAGFGFRRIGERCGYYPAHAGREDAWVLALEL